MREIWGGGGATVTTNVQDCVTGLASVAVHCTLVAPMGNIEPDAAVQLTCTGVTPPDVVGDAKVTATGPPLREVAARLAGQAMLKPGGGGGGVPGGSFGVGRVGVDEVHAATAKAVTQNGTVSKRRNRRMAGQLPILLRTAQPAANSKQPGVVRMVPVLVNDKLAGTSAPVAKNCTVRTFSPLSSKT